MMKPLLFAVAFALLVGSAAFGHIFPDRCEPAVGSTVKTSPAVLKIWFTDPIDVPHSTIHVLDAAGKPVDLNDVHGDAKDDLLAAVSLPKLPAGVYTVQWAATSVHDGHRTKGEWKFTIAP